MTLTPMLCARLISRRKRNTPSAHNWFYRVSEARLRRACSAATNARCSWSLRHRALHLRAVPARSLAATVQMFRVMPQDFLPSEDIDQLNATTEGANGISFAEMRRHQDEAAKIFAADPNIEGVQSSVDNSNRGNFSIQHE